MIENVPFTERLIRKLQSLPKDPGFVDACTSYLLQHGRLVFDNKRGLFWVVPPSGPPQVAVWMPMLEPDEEEGWIVITSAPPAA